MLAELAAEDQDAANFAARTVFLGFAGSHVLLPAVAASAKFLTEPGSGTAAEMAGVVIAVNLTANISGTDVGVGFLGCLGGISGKMRIPAFVATIAEEALAGRSGIVGDVVALLAEEIRRIEKIEDVYALAPIALVLPELERAAAGSVDILLSAVLGRLENQEHQEPFVVLFETIVDLLILSASLVKWQPHFQQFRRLVETWKLSAFKGDESAELSCQLSLFTHFFLTFPSPVTSVPISKDKMAVFGTTDDRILQVGAQTLVSLGPVGRFEWEFTSLATEAPPFKLDDDVDIEAHVLQEDECEQQTAFADRLGNFFNDLYEKELGARLCVPADFEASPIELAPNPPVRPRPQLVPPSSVGSPAIAFLSSLKFCDGMAPPQFFPGRQHALEDSESSRYFLHTIRACFVENSNPHFEHFKTGLGFLDGSGQSIVFTGVQHEIEFSLSHSAHPIVIVWLDGLSQESYLASFHPHNQIRIEIQSQPTGLMLVQIRVSRQFALDFPGFDKVLVSKRALPVFVIGQILSLAHVLDLRSNSVVYPLVDSRTRLRNLRGADFYSHAVLLECAKELLALAPSGSFP
jgi:hypothetical protein